MIVKNFKVSANRFLGRLSKTLDLSINTAFSQSYKRLSQPCKDKLYTQDCQSISSLLENWTFCCHVLGSRHCTRAYTETVDPACRPIASLNSGTGTVLYGMGQLGLIWLKTSRLPACSDDLAILFIYDPSNCWLLFSAVLRLQICSFFVMLFTNGSPCEEKSEIYFLRPDTRPKLE